MGLDNKIACYCSPANESKYHFSTASLKKMIDIFNMINTENIKTSTEPANLYKSLKFALKKYLKNNVDKYWLWCGVIERIAEKNIKDEMKLLRIKRQLRLISNKDLLPQKPESWYKNPKTWLSNYDIQNVMIQYMQAPKYKYVFLGVFPIDFAVIGNNGTCMYSSLCTVDVQSYLKKGKKFLGIITNLDKHDQSGSHWTSTFMTIDPSLPTYGAFYYDSTGNSIPSYLLDFLKSIKEQCNKLHPKNEFKIFQNKKQHQRKNTECGVFSMLFQIRWLNKHIVKKNQTSFLEIIGNPFIDDAHMLMIRDHLFRPNTKMELKKLGLSI